jgi:flagellar secretion chaperone FliS
MFSLPSNPAQAYSSTGVSSGAMSASPHGLVLMLYEGAMLAVSAARMHMQLGQKAEKSRAISKAIAIISDGLMASLDTRAGGEIAERLLVLYQYMIEKLSEANVRNLPDRLEEVGRLLAELNDAWKSIAKTPAAQAAAVAAGT